MVTYTHETHLQTMRASVHPALRKEVHERVLFPYLFDHLPEQIPGSWNLHPCMPNLRRGVRYQEFQTKEVLLRELLQEKKSNQRHPQDRSSGVLVLVSHEEQAAVEREVQASGHGSTVGGLRGFSIRHGAARWEEKKPGQGRQREGLLAGQLSVGEPVPTRAEPKEQQATGISWRGQIDVGVGRDLLRQLPDIAASSQTRVEHRTSPVGARQIERQMPLHNVAWRDAVNCRMGKRVRNTRICDSKPSQAGVAAERNPYQTSYRKNESSRARRYGSFDTGVGEEVGIFQARGELTSIPGVDRRRGSNYSDPTPTQEVIGIPIVGNPTVEVG